MSIGAICTPFAAEVLGGQSQAEWVRLGCGIPDLAMSNCGT
jgi:hypothetical protein